MAHIMYLSIGNSPFDIPKIRRSFGRANPLLGKNPHGISVCVHLYLLSTPLQASLSLHNPPLPN